MHFLTLNGVKVSVAADSVSMTYVGVGGESSRSPSGELVGGPTVTKREWTMTTTPVPASEVAAWTGLIEGAGHVWSFDEDFYSSRGRGVEQGGDVNSVSLTSGAKFGPWAANAADDGGTEAFIALPFTTTWTFAGWLKDIIGSGWRHFVFTSGAAEWTDGVLASSGAADCFNVHGTPGQLDFHTFTSGAYVCDDLVYLPYAVPDSWPAQMYTRHAASAWSALPRVLAAGDFAPAPVVVRGKVTDTKALRYSVAGTMTTGYMLEFTLREV